MEVLGGYLAWAKICSLITAFHVALVDKPLFWAWWKILHRLRFRSIERETDPCENWAQACEFGQMDLKIGGLDLRKSWQTDSTRLDGVNVSLGSVGSSLAKADFCLGVVVLGCLVSTTSGSLLWASKSKNIALKHSIRHHRNLKLVNYK